MKLTVLDMVQDILSDMNSDQVNSITDTQESLQVAQIIKTVYYDMLSTRNWPHMKRMFQLEGLGDTAMPTVMKLPVGLHELEWINYNVRKDTDPTRVYMQPMRYLEPADFINRTNQRNNTESNVDRVSEPTGLQFMIRTDIQPTRWTSFDDTHICFDARDNDFDATLHAEMTQCYGVLELPYVNVDTFVPDLPAEAFSALLAEAKSTAFVMLRQEQNPKAEMTAQKAQRWLSRKAWRAHGGVKYPNYGRTPTLAGRRKNPLFEPNA